VIEGQLGLQLSPEKTKIVTFAEGFDFLGFHINETRLTIRAKSMKKLQEKIKVMTIRSHNFSDDVIQEINAMLRGVANYYRFAGRSCVKTQFKELDELIRRRLRSMKTKRISHLDNRKIPNRLFEKHGLVSLCSLL
jgi:RNA-directed DNA polymerase